MKRISVPDELYEQLRREAARERVSVSELVKSRLAIKHRRRKPLARDPLEDVIGIVSDGTLTRDLDKELYEL